MILRRFQIASAFALAALVGLVERPAVAIPPSGTLSVYGTTGAATSGTSYAGGTINVSNTVRLDDGATVSGSSIVDNGLFQFNQSAGNLLTISNTITGNGTLSLINSGTLNLTGKSGPPASGVVLDMTTSAAAGLLQISTGTGASGTGALYVGYTGTGSLTLAGGNVTTGALTISNTSSAFGSVTMSSGTLTAANVGIGGSGTGTFTMTGGNVDCLSPYIGNNAQGVGTFTDIVKVPTPWALLPM